MGPLMSRIVMASGAVFSTQDFDSASLKIEDIANALAHTVRWRGALGPWSVAEHSLLVAKALKKRDAAPITQLFGLLHDAAEAILGDMPSPLKGLPELRGFCSLEQRLQKGMYGHFAGRCPTAIEERAIASVDKAAAGFEVHMLASPRMKKTLFAEGLVLNTDLVEVVRKAPSPAVAAQWFLARFAALSASTKAA